MLCLRAVLVSVVAPSQDCLMEPDALGYNEASSMCSSTVKHPCNPSCCVSFSQQLSDHMYRHDIQHLQALLPAGTMRSWF
jgi:hypothetical protein